MIYLKKLFSLGYKGLKKLVSLVRNRFDLAEVKILLIGLILSFLTCLYLLELRLVWGYYQEPIRQSLLQGSIRYLL